MKTSVNFRVILTWILMIILVLYTIAVSAYSLYVGGKSAEIVAKYYDYTAYGVNSTIGISITALPRGVYKTNRSIAGVMITFPAVGLGFLVIGFLCVLHKEISSKVFVVFSANFVSIIGPFVMSCYATWLVHSLSTDDTNFWNSVNTGFIDNLWKCQTILILTAVPGVLYMIAFCVYQCAECYYDVFGK